MVFDFPMLFRFEQNGGHLLKTIGFQNKMDASLSKTIGNPSEMATLRSVFQWFGFRMVGTTAYLFNSNTKS